jgi:hypothetical protein
VVLISLVFLLSAADLVVGGDIRVNGNDIKDGGGTAAITFDGSGNTTITGNLNVNGSTTQVNTTTLTIEDNLIELGKVDGSAPISDLNKDVGILLHYFDDAARLSAVYYDDSVSRVVLASKSWRIFWCINSRCWVLCKCRTSRIICY